MRETRGGANESKDSNLDSLDSRGGFLRVNPRNASVEGREDPLAPWRRRVRAWVRSAPAASPAHDARDFSPSRLECQVHRDVLFDSPLQ